MRFDLIKNRRGQGLVEYALIIAGVALICAVGISLLGHKTGDMIDAVAVVLPGAHAADNGPITQGELITTTTGANGITLDMTALSQSQPALGQNVAGNSTEGFGGLITDPQPAAGS